MNSTDFSRNREAVIALKRSLNPATGKSWTYAAIGNKLNMSPQLAAYYGKAAAKEGVCSVCLRPLRKVKK